MALTPSEVDRISSVERVSATSRPRAWASASSSVTASAAGIPRHFLWAVDITVLCAAFDTAFFVAPHLKHWVLQSNVGAQAWLAALSPEIAGEFRPMREVIWVLLVMGAVTLLSMQSFGGYRPITQQSRTRIILSTISSPLIGLSSVALVLFTLRSPSWSRLFIYLFTAIAAFGLCSARLSLRWYRLQRVASGFYTRNVVLIGPTRALEWMAAHFAETTLRSHYRVLGYLASGGQQSPSCKAKTGSED